MTQTCSEIDHQPAGRIPQRTSGLAEALVMLDLFEGLGVRSFALTLTDEAGRKVAFRPHRSVRALRTELPGLLLASYQRRLNIIVRPLAARALSLVQLDDLTPSRLDRVRGFSFLALETSPENFQAWVAVEGAGTDTIRRIKKAARADLNASGATRLAGSHNFKSKYAPDYPCVRLQSIAPKRIVTVAELDRAGLAGPEERRSYAPRHAPCFKPRDRLSVWPSYARCLADAPAAKNHEGKDRSSAGFEFCLISIDRGWSVDATADQLMDESEKARSIGYKYALFTAKRAACVVSENRR
jgi:hypothetical protein